MQPFAPRRPHTREVSPPYFVGGEKIAEFDDGGARPGATVTRQVDFGDRAGQQKVLAVWNIADTPNAFCARTDVKVS